MLKTRLSGEKQYLVGSGTKTGLKVVFVAGDQCARDVPSGFAKQQSCVVPFRLHTYNQLPASGKKAASDSQPEVACVRRCVRRLRYPLLYRNSSSLSHGETIGRAIGVKDRRGERRLCRLSESQAVAKEPAIRELNTRHKASIVAPSRKRQRGDFP